uniref:Uncharacterized protein n=1 Tax=Arundo donax TaxID=35708 RepID=A0A0A8XSP3_ARUDO
MCAKTHPGTLKWKSQEMTKANTMQASRKLRNRCPCQNLRVSAGGPCTTATLSVSLHWSLNCGSPKTTTLLAVELHISQILFPLILNQVSAHCLWA